MYFSEAIINSDALRRPICIYIGDAFYTQSSIYTLGAELRNALANITPEVKASITASITYGGERYRINAKVLSLILFRIYMVGSASIIIDGEAITLENDNEDLLSLFCNVHTESLYIDNKAITSVIGIRE